MIYSLIHFCNTYVFFLSHLFFYSMIVKYFFKMGNLHLISGRYSCFSYSSILVKQVHNKTGWSYDTNVWITELPISVSVSVSLECTANDACTRTVSRLTMKFKRRKLIDFLLFPVVFHSILSAIAALYVLFLGPNLGLARR